jgi:hypothetical protein
VRWLLERFVLDDTNWVLVFLPSRHLESDCAYQRGVGKGTVGGFEGEEGFSASQGCGVSPRTPVARSWQAREPTEWQTLM